MNLPTPITKLILAQNTHNSTAYADLFSDDAIVYDEGKTYHGKDQIKRWNGMTNAKYKTKLEPVEIISSSSIFILSVTVSGSFDGSPITLKYNFEIKENKIHSLRIT